jgi:type I restriction-modification system DNA methylase subunit
MPRGRSNDVSLSAKKPNGNGGNLGFESQLFLAADKLRKNLEPSHYKHVALGLIFLKYISNAFEAKQAALLAEDATAAEDPDEYLAERVFWVPKEARWSHGAGAVQQLEAPVYSQTCSAVASRLSLCIRDGTPLAIFRTFS